MRHGTINCQCGQTFYFESDHKDTSVGTGIYKDEYEIMIVLPPKIRCIQCGEQYDITDYPEKPLEPQVLNENPEQSEPDQYISALSSLEHSLDISSSIMDATLKGLGYTLVKIEGDQNGTDI